MNLIGKKFGKLYVIEKTNEKAKNNGEYKYMSVSNTLYQMFMEEHNNIGNMFKE